MKINFFFLIFLKILKEFFVFGNQCYPLGLDNQDVFDDSVFISKTSNSDFPPRYARLSSRGFFSHCQSCYVGVKFGKVILIKYI